MSEKKSEILGIKVMRECPSCEGVINRSGKPTCINCRGTGVIETWMGKQELIEMIFNADISGIKIKK